MSAHDAMIRPHSHPTQETGSTLNPRPHTSIKEKEEQPKHTSMKEKNSKRKENLKLNYTWKN